MGRWFAVLYLGFSTLASSFFASAPQGPLQAQAAPPSAAPADGAADIHVDFKMDVLLVEFDVSVHTRKGDFITGLRQEQFRLFEDGQPVPITSFEELLQKSDPDAPPGAVQATGRNFLIFVDTYLASTRKVMQIRRELVRFLERDLTEGDSLSLAVLGPLGALTVSPGVRIDEAVLLANSIAPPLGRFSTPGDNSYEQAHHVLAQVERAVSEVLGAPVPPPRSLIFLSPGFVPSEPEEGLDADEIGGIVESFAPAGVGPSRGGFDPFRPEETRSYRGRIQRPSRKDRPDDLPSIEALMNSLAGWLSARNITLYSVNCGDKGPLDLFAPSHGIAEIAGAPAFGGALVGVAAADNLKLNMLRDLAELTGGLAWLSTRAYHRAFHHIDQATACVYRIGFRPDTDRPRGRYHKLKVVVVHDKKVKVRYPRGYLDS